MQFLQHKIDRFCARHPRFGIPNLMLVILMIYGVIFFLDAFSSNYLSSLLYFDMARILRGEFWRLFTFVLLPPGSRSIIFFAIMMVFYYFIGSTLERHWGTAKFNLFVLSGALLTLLAGILIGFSGGPMVLISLYYIFFSMFFSVALLYPDMTIYLMFILPVKAKWAAWLTAAVFLYEILMPFSQGVPFASLLPLFALLNYFILFSGDLSHYLRQSASLGAHKLRKRQKTVDFQSAQRHAREKKGYLHKCAVCGRTDSSNPELEFRYCSKCKGYYCYCADHINSHVHVE